MYVNEHVEDGTVKMILVKYVDNDSNIFTNNLSTELHEKHSKKMVFKKSCFKNILKSKGRVLEMTF